MHVTNCKFLSTIVFEYIVNYTGQTMKMFRIDDLLKRTEDEDQVYCDVHGGMVKISALVGLKKFIKFLVYMIFTVYIHSYTDYIKKSCTANTKKIHHIT